MNISAGLVGAAAAFALAGSAQGAVTVIGGGLAEACSKAAISGQSGVEFEDVCTAALETEFLKARDRAGTYVNRGVFKLRRMNYEAAHRDFNRAISLKPDIGEAWVNRGAALIGQRRFAESLEHINKGIDLGVEEPAKAYYNRALAHEGLEDAKSAYFDYQKALELMPTWSAPREQLARFTVTTRPRNGS